jgi:hypothetical protein
MEAGGVDPGQCLEAGRDGRGLGLQDVPDPIVVGGDGKAYGYIWHFPENIQVPGNQG